MISAPLSYVAGEFFCLLTYELLPRSPSVSERA